MLETYKEIPIHFSISHLTLKPSTGIPQFCLSTYPPSTEFCCTLLTLMKTILNWQGQNCCSDTTLNMLAYVTALCIVAKQPEHWCLSFLIPLPGLRSKVPSCQKHSSHTDPCGVYNTLCHAELNYIDEKKCKIGAGMVQAGGWGERKSKPNIGLTTENKAHKPIFGGIYCPKVTQIIVYLTA